MPDVLWVYTSICLGCPILLFTALALNPSSHKDVSTNTYTQGHTNCPLFAKGSKSSSLGNLESGPAALWQVGLQLTLASLK